MFYGTPTVTMPNNSLKSNVVYGAYKQMKIENPPIVKNIEEYVDKAIEFANMKEKTMLDNKNYFSECANNHLYENKEFISELLKFREVTVIIRIKLIVNSVSIFTKCKSI